MTNLAPDYRWSHLAPGWLLPVLLATDGFLWLSERFRWFAFNQHKGWAVLIALASVGAFVLLMFLWFLLALTLRWRFQFSVRSLLVLPVVVAIPCNWLAVEMKAAREQREVVADVVEFGGRVVYDYQIDRSDTKSQPPAPPWLRGLLGDDFFGDVTTVIAHEGLSHNQMFFAVRGRILIGGDFVPERVKGLPQLRELDMLGAPLTDAGLRHLVGVTTLQKLNLWCGPVTNAGLEYLKGLHNCERWTSAAPK